MESPIRELLRSSDFLRLWLVGAFANAMRWLELLASGLFAWEVTHSALAVTAVVAARQLPQLLFGAFAGAVSEAVNRKLIVMAALLVPALVSTLLASLAMTGHLELWHVALGNLLSGTMWASEMSTRRRMVGEVAGPHRIANAIALDSATSAATRMIGPVLGGLAFETLHMSGAYTLTALVQFAGAFAMAGLVHPQITRRLNLGRIPAEIAEGLAFAHLFHGVLQRLECLKGLRLRLACAANAVFVPSPLELSACALHRLSGPIELLLVQRSKEGGILADFLHQLPKLLCLFAELPLSVPLLGELLALLCVHRL